MDEPAMRHTTKYLTRCDLCGKTHQHFYSANFGGTSYKFCSGTHLQRAKANFEEKKNMVFDTPREEVIDYELNEPGD